MSRRTQPTPDDLRRQADELARRAAELEAQAQQRGPGTDIVPTKRTAALATTAADTGKEVARAGAALARRTGSAVNAWSERTADRFWTAIDAEKRRRSDLAYRKVQQTAMRKRKGTNPAPNPAYVPNLRRAGRSLTAHDAAGILIHAWEPPVASAGPIMGREQHSGTVVRIDPWFSYQRDVNSPNIFVPGQQGFGKTMFLLLFIARQIFAGRFAVAIDSKDTGGEGEIARVGRRLGWTVITFGSRHRARINILDRRISRRSDDENALTQATLLYAVAETALGRVLHPTEREALAAALDAVQGDYTKALARWEDANATLGEEATARPDEPILSDLLTAVFFPTKEAADAVNMTQHELTLAGRDVGLILRDFLRTDLGMTLNAQTDLGIDLNAPAIVFDLSQLPKDGIALPIVMTVVNTFLQNVWWKNDGRKRILAIDEAAPLLRHLGTARALQASLKTSRGKGLAHLIAIQQTEDITGQTDPILERAIQSVVNEAETIVAFRQDEAQAKALAGRRALTHRAIARLQELPTGHAIVKMGSRVPFEIKTDPQAIEMAIMHSDAAMIEEAVEEHEPVWWNTVNDAEVER